MGEPAAAATSIRLSDWLGSAMIAPGGKTVGKVDDVIARLRAGDYPLVIGLVVAVGPRRLFLPIDRVASTEPRRTVLRAAQVDLRSFERREGEVLLRQDVLGHRLIDVAHAELVRASDAELRSASSGWVVACLSTRRPSGLLGFARRRGAAPWQDWASFEPLVGHAPSFASRMLLGRLTRLKPAQLADLLEEASTKEGTELLEAVHSDPELEADVFEELHPDLATRLFAGKSDPEVADVLTRMRPDDAADALASLPQGRRQQVLEQLPAGTRSKLLTLLRFNPASAGGLMNLDLVACGASDSVSDGLEALQRAAHLEMAARTSVHVVSKDGTLVGVVPVVEMLQAGPQIALGGLADLDPVRVSADTDLVDVALVMADYNLLTVPVVDPAGRLLGIVTVDDVLEATIPDDWRRREPAPRPEAEAHLPPAQTS